MTDIDVPNYQGASAPVYGPSGYVGVVIREVDPAGHGWVFTLLEPNGAGTYTGHRDPNIAADTLRAIARFRQETRPC